MTSAGPPDSPAPSDGAPVVSIRNVTHRYKSVVALDGISLEVPRGLMVGIVGPDGVGKSTLLALVAGSRKMQQGERHRAGRRHPRRPAPARGGPTHRLHAPGAGQEPVPGPQRLRQRRLHGQALRAFGRGAQGAHHGTAEVHRAGPVPGSPGRQAVGRNEAEGRPVRRARPRAGSPHPRRTHHRRGPALPAPVLDPHRRHPRGPPGDERHHLHRVHGRGRALGLGRRHGRRTRPGDGNAGAADGADRHERTWSSASSRCCPRRSGWATRSSSFRLARRARRRSRSRPTV